MSFKKISIAIACISVPAFIWLFWSTPDTLTTDLSKYQKAGEEVRVSLSSLPTLPIKEEDKRYIIEDTTKDGVQITYANQSDNAALAAEPQQEKPSLTLHFPKDYANEPIVVQIAEGKSILIQDKTAKGDYIAEALSLGSEASSVIPTESSSGGIFASMKTRFLDKLGMTQKKEAQSYLSYTDETKRVTTYYTYGHDQATGEKQLKNWQVYTEPSIIKGEQVAYSFTNAKLKKNEDGTISVFYYGDQELQNDKAAADVDPSLMARAQRTLAKEMGDSINSGETAASFTIPKPYYINNNGDKIDLDWRLSMDGKDISIDFTPEANEYPLALDPTLSFTAPGQSNTGDVITGESTSQSGNSLIAGDFNTDGRTDLAVGGSGYSAIKGRVYIFYNDGSLSSSSAAGADVIITGESSLNGFGSSLISGDLNADGRTDLAVGAYGYSSNTGRAYIFYNDGSIPTTAATADVIMTGETTSNFFGSSLAVGDFNTDGRIDLTVVALTYSSNTGRAYIFYNDGVSFGTAACTTGCLAADADVIITGEATADQFGASPVAGDFNADGKTDLAIGAGGYSTQTGRAYIFYNDGSIPTTAATADVIITGETAGDSFGNSLVAGDFNADGRTDLTVGAFAYSSNAGRAYIFYADGTNNFGTATCAGTPAAACSAANADTIITGEATAALFGSSLAASDFNADGRTDLAAGAYDHDTTTGRAYIFYNDGSIPSTAATADVIITGQATNNSFGSALAAADFNNDGRTDLAVGAPGYFTTGRAYIFYSQNGQVNTNQNITGNASGDYFGNAMTTGDFNADGRTDLAVGATGYSTNTGRVYIFYGDGQIPTTAATADVTITGETTSNYFGASLAVGDLNADGKTDLVVGAYGYSSSTGRAYIFYNDGSIPTTAATADVAITGQASSNSFGYFGSLTVGDFNADGKTDLAVGAYGYSSSTGRAYIFYADGTNDFGTASCTGSSPTVCLAANADVIITGDVFSVFGDSLIAGDLNADGRTDLVVGDDLNKIYIFYNDGSIPTTFATADVTISTFTTPGLGYPMAVGDFNTDGRTDLAVGSPSTSSSAGKVYIFYNDGSLPTTTATADVTLSGEASSQFGSSLVAGDFNADGRTDLAVGATAYSTSTGRAYIFYNDGSYPTTAATADVIITGETTSNSFGYSFASGDFSGDGRADLVVGARGYSTNTGRIYLYETRENFAWKLQPVSPATGGLRTGLQGTGQEMKITGEASSSFGYSMTTGDFNSDGKIDLAVGSPTYNSNTGRVYVFYNDGSIALGASNADVVISGNSATYNNFGSTIISGDFNADGKTDLVANAPDVSGGHSYLAIFYNTGTFPNTITKADIIMHTGLSYKLGFSMAAGDVNADGKTDLIVGDYGYANSEQRTYIFYNDGSYPTDPGLADVIINGETSWTHSFGYAVTVGDLNADGKTDVIVSAVGATTSTGKVYIFYADGTNNFGTATCSGSVPTTCSAANADVIITGETTNNYFGSVMTTGDFNADGKIDLVAGAYGYSTNTGRAYIFYNDGSIPTTAATADVTITGETTSNYFGWSFAAGDFNADGRTDLAVGAKGYSSSTGRAYIFYNDGSIPSTAATADVTLTGEATSNYYGAALAAGDFNSDGKTDLAVGAYGYSTSTGRAYIYTMNDPVITGETTSNSFGTSLVSGDFNADGKIDLAVGASGYSTNTGRVYLFYQDGTIPNTAATADVTITGEATNNYFSGGPNGGLSGSLAAGDFNADGRIDLAVGAKGYSTNTGRAYIFYNDGSIPTAAASADVIITGTGGAAFGSALAVGDLNSDGRVDLAVGSSVNYTYIFYNDGSIPTTSATADVNISGADYFGSSFTTGDFNADGRIDLAVGAWYYSGSSTYTGHAYIFYNDGSYPATAASADVTITGEDGLSGRFGFSMASGDFNADGKTDIIIGAYRGSRAYIFYNDGSIPTTAATADVIIAGAGGDYFGVSFTTGDFNADGRIDFVVGAGEGCAVKGCAYIFYNDGSIPTTAATADVAMIGESAVSYFGTSLASGDFNADGKTDLVVGAYGYSSSTGRVYLFTSEAKVVSDDLATKIRGSAKFKGSIRW